MCIVAQDGGSSASKASGAYAVVDTILWKTRSKGIRRSSRWKAEYNRSIEGREEWSTRFADSQKGSMLTVGQLVNVIS
jgi:hypothetical protein